MLGRVAGAYEREVRVAVRRLVATLEPAIIVVLGLVVLGIVLAILLAILSVNELRCEVADADIASSPPPARRRRPAHDSAQSARARRDSH